MLFFNRTRSCAPKAAILVVIAAMLLAFWGVFYFGVRFLRVASPPEETVVSDQNQKVLLEIDKDGEIEKMIKTREENRGKLNF